MTTRIHRARAARFAAIAAFATLATVAALAATACHRTTVATPPPDQLPLGQLAALAARAEATGQPVVTGRDGWLFYAPELRALAAGEFWGEAAARASRAENPADADPLPAILDFQAQLARHGIDLLVVPVPARAAIYADKLPEEIPRLAAGTRLDPYHQRFYRLLGERGVKVLDLTEPFLAARDDGSPLFCRQDAHWVGRGIAIAAHAIATAIGEREWRPPSPATPYLVSVERRVLTGDLWTDLPEPRPQREEADIEVVEQPGGGLLKTWRKSPVLLLGDSYVLSFHTGGDLQAKGAGLPDHLAKELGFPVDYEAVRNGGSTPARINLLRRGDGLASKRVVVWVFSMREFTEGAGWKKLEILR